MLKLVTGPFHPGLESALIDHLKTIKKEIFSRAAVVTPSARLMDHLQMVAASSELPLINVHFHTFSSLAHELVAEAGGLDKPVLSDSLFFDTLVKILVKKSKPFPDLPDLAVPHGFPPQIRGTLRDMVDAGVPPQGPVLLEAVKENFLGADVDLGWLLELFRFYQIYTDRVNALKDVCPPVTVLQKAIRMAPESQTLKAFNEIIYYGFYDVTGLQRDFFEAIVKHHSATLYYPYVKDNGNYRFASRLRESFLLGLARDEQSLHLKPPHPAVQIINVSGLSDEAGWVASETARLHFEEGVPYSRMAVVSRSQDRLRHFLPAVFARRSIPFRTAARDALAAHPKLEAAVQALHANHDTLSGKDAWADRVGIAQDILREIPLPDLFLESLDDLRCFDGLGECVSVEEFIDTCREKWMRLPISVPGQTDLGVTLLYAEAARGLSFDVVFLIGVEEKVFPRVLREDPFLRDSARFQLQQTLGFKISQKLTALEEEQLLFELIVSSARRHLILTYQRSDESGSVVGPSSFLRSYANEKKIDLDTQATIVPRMVAGKMMNCNPWYLSPKECINGFLLVHDGPSAVETAQKTHLDSRSLKRGLAFSESLQAFGEPGEMDGCVQITTWDDVFRNGQGSASSMETFGRCPFQYFATRLLDLAPLEDKEPGVRIAADKKGTLVHTFFENFYRTLEFDRFTTDGFPEAHFNRLFTETFDPVSADEMEVHPLIWEVAKHALTRDLREFLKRDLADLVEQHLIPSCFEEPITGRLPEVDPELNWYAKPDRVDVGENQVRVLDYKTGHIVKKVSLASLQGLKLQPPLYMMLIQTYLKEKGVDKSSISFLYHTLAEKAPMAELTYEDWLTNKKDILNTLTTQLALMRKGLFLILPDDKYCGWCDVRQICRKNHGPSLSRSQNGAGKILRSLREKK